MADKVTRSLLLGVVGINESDAEGATTCLLDISMRFGMVFEEEKCAWRTGWDAT